MANGKVDPFSPWANWEKGYEYISQPQQQKEEEPKERSFQELWDIQTAIEGGTPSSNSKLANAVKAYKMIEADARRDLESRNIDPNSENGQRLIDLYISGMYKDSDISLDDVRNAITNMGNANDLQAQKAQSMAEQEKRNQFLGAYEDSAASELSHYTPSGDRKPQTPLVGQQGAISFDWQGLKNGAQNTLFPTMPPVPNQDDPTLPYMNGG